MVISSVTNASRRFLTKTAARTFILGPAKAKATSLVANSGSNVRLVLPASKQLTAARCFASSLNITYSGGQATEGQGGFYGSGGARHAGVSADDNQLHTRDRSSFVALESDIQRVSQVMEEIDRLDHLLVSSEAEHNDNKSKLTDAVTDDVATAGNNDKNSMNEIVAIKGQIKHLITSKDFMDSLNNLECKSGLPIWGLSVEERELIVAAREKIKSC